MLRNLLIPYFLVFFLFQYCTDCLVKSSTTSEASTLNRSIRGFDGVMREPFYTLCCDFFISKPVVIGSFPFDSHGLISGPLVRPLAVRPRNVREVPRQNFVVTPNQWADKWDALGIRDSFSKWAFWRDVFSRGRKNYMNIFCFNDTRGSEGYLYFPCGNDLKTHLQHSSLGAYQLLSHQCRLFLSGYCSILRSISRTNSSCGLPLNLAISFLGNCGIVNSSACSGDSSDSSSERHPKKRLLQGMLFVALGFFVIGYGVRRCLDGGSDGGSYFGLFLFPGLTGIFYGTFLLLNYFYGPVKLCS